MARRRSAMFSTSFSGVSRNLDGTIRSNAKMDILLDRKEFNKQVTNVANRAIRKELKALGITPAEEIKKPIKPIEPSDNNTENVGKKDTGGIQGKGRDWQVSTAGGMMIANSMLSNGIGVATALHGGDKAVADQRMVSGTVGSAILGVGAFGGPYGMLLATTLSIVYSLVGDAIGNALQNRHDLQRLNYKMDNYDVNKHGTYIYDSNSSKWLAQDINKIERSILGKKSSK